MSCHTVLAEYKSVCAKAHTLLYSLVDDLIDALDIRVPFDQ